MSSTAACTPVSKSPTNSSPSNKIPPTSPTAMQSAGGYEHGASPLARVVLKRPHESVQDQYFIDANWQKEGWTEKPEFNALADDHYRMMKKLQSLGIQTRCQGGDWVVAMNSMMVRDTCIITPTGKVIECPQKTPNRIGDSEEGATYLDQMGLSKLGTVNPDSNVRGSDFVFISKDLVVAGLTSATDEDGIKEVSEFLKQETPDIAVVTADLRSGYGAAASRGFTKMSDRLCCALSPVQESVVVACRDIIGGPCCKALEETYNVDIVSVSLEEWEVGCSDILSLTPKKCLLRRVTCPSEGDGAAAQAACQALGAPEEAAACLMRTEDDIPPNEPSFKLRQTLKQEYGIRTYYLYLNNLYYSGAGLTPFLQPYKRE